jgi:hypothetical protein
LIVRAKELRLRRTRIQRMGCGVRSINIDSILITDAKFLVGEGYSLDQLAQTTGVSSPDFKKSCFPFSRLTNFAFLDSPTLPTDVESWSSRLGGGKVVDRSDVEEAISIYEAKGFRKVSLFLDYYLALDCLLLLRSIKALADTYYDILGLHIIDTWKFTVSSLSSAGASAHLFRTKAPGIFSPLYSRLYSVSKKL